MSIAGGSIEAGVRRRVGLKIPLGKGFHMAKELQAFPTAPVALQTLSKLRKEVANAKTFEQLDAAARTASGIQKAFKPVREVADEAGLIWTAALNRLAEELAKLPKAKGARGGGKKASPRGPLLEPRDKTPTLAELGVTKRQSAQARALGKIPSTEQKAHVAELKANGHDITPTNIIKLHKEATREAKRAEYASKVQSGGSAKDLISLAKSGQKFSVIYADPPWTFEVYSGKGKERSAERHYDTMSLEAIAELPVADLAAEDCALLLWAVWPELPGALDIIKRWGFTYKTVGFVWVKQNRSGEGIFTGMGYWTRANTEPCLLATRGSPKRLAMDVPQVILSPVAAHSEKPEEAASRIMRLVPGPHLELFARQSREGWTTWGNEICRE
jgi:N6-adenosine-specific RNA methylase IME4